MWSSVVVVVYERAVLVEEVSFVLLCFAECFYLAYGCGSALACRDILVPSLREEIPIKGIERYLRMVRGYIDEVVSERKSQ